MQSQNIYLRELHCKCNKLELTQERKLMTVTSVKCFHASHAWLNIRELTQQKNPVVYVWWKTLKKKKKKKRVLPCSKSEN